MRFAQLAFVALAATSHVSGRVLHRLSNRAVTDICANPSNSPLAVNLGGVGKVVIGIINTCLCVSGISTFIEQNIVAQAATVLVGQAAVTATLIIMINTAAGHETCTYPDHFSGSVCTPENPCGFTCKDGFTPFPPVNPTECTCSPPKIVCNGQCISSAACPSPVGNPVRRDLSYTKNFVCDDGYTACGLYGSGSKSWDCVDTRSDLESCGGCVIPLAFGSPRGIDCTAIQGVADVSCMSGSCMIQRCLSGYTPSVDNTFCIRNEDIEATFDSSVLAAAYGLEHVPLIKKGLEH